MADAAEAGPLVDTEMGEEQQPDPETQRAAEQVELARERMLSAALAFCDGTISAGQLRAVRELLREKESHLAELEQAEPLVFMEEDTSEELVPDSPLAEAPLEGQLEIQTNDAPEMMGMLDALDEKLDRLEDDFQNGRINSSQYRAIRRHYQEQREVAMRLKESHPKSDRWRVVLEEGRTTFLMQLNEATCTCVALFDLETRERIFTQGDMPAAAEEAMDLVCC